MELVYPNLPDTFPPKKQQHYTIIFECESSGDEWERVRVSRVGCILAGYNLYTVTTNEFSRA